MRWESQEPNVISCSKKSEFYKMGGHCNILSRRVMWYYLCFKKITLFAMGEGQACMQEGHLGDYYNIPGKRV